MKPEIGADERLIERLRSGVERADGDRLEALLADWRDDAHREAPAFVRPASTSGLNRSPAGEEPDPTTAAVTGALSATISAVGPEAATRPGGDTTNGDRALNDPTPAQTAAAHLRRLADHLNAHPDLIAPYGLTGLDETRIHIQLTDSTRSSFTRWAESINGGGFITVKPPLNREHGGRIARVRGRIAGDSVEVFDGRVTWSES